PVGMGGLEVARQPIDLTARKGGKAPADGEDLVLGVVGQTEADAPIDGAGERSVAAAPGPDADRAGGVERVQPEPLRAAIELLGQPAQEPGAGGSEEREPE